MAYNPGPKRGGFPWGCFVGSARDSYLPAIIMLVPHPGNRGREEDYG